VAARQPASAQRLLDLLIVSTVRQCFPVAREARQRVTPCSVAVCVRNRLAPPRISCSAYRNRRGGCSSA
jgi:hypothetical protein